MEHAAFDTPAFERRFQIGNLAFTTVKSSTYRKNVGGNAPSPHALADDTLATLAYVRLSSTTDVLRHYVRTVKTGTYIHASTTLLLKFSLRLAPLASVRKSRSSRRTSAAPGPILALIYAENPAGAAAVALARPKTYPWPFTSGAFSAATSSVIPSVSQWSVVVPPSVVMPSATRSV